MAKKSGTAAQRRARAEAARAAVARAQKRRRWTIVAVVAAVVVILAGVVTAVVLVNRSQTTTGGTAAGRDSAPPWSVPSDTQAAVKKAGLPMLATEGTVLHIHIHLDVLANGQAVSVPADIGIDEQAQQISPLHTHDTTGIVHIESPTKRTFTLGQFFTEWQVSLGADHIGGLKAGGDKQFHAYVNGSERAGSPADIVLHAHDEIALVYGTSAQQANPPSKYSFPSGY